MKTVRNILVPVIGLSIAWAPFFVVSHFKFPSLLSLIDIPSIVLTYGGAFIFLFIIEKPINILNAIENIGSFRISGELLQSLKVARSWGIAFVLCGILLTLYSLFRLFDNMSDPSAIWPSISIAYLSTFYGIHFALIFAFPAYLLFEKRLEKEKMLVEN